MIKSRKRVPSLSGSPLAEIPSIKRRLIEGGRDVIDLGAGDSDTPPARLGRTLARVREERLATAS